MNAVDSDDPHLVDKALAQGADVNGQPYSLEAEASTPLYIAVQERRGRATRQLIVDGADVNRVDSCGTPLDAAAKSGDVEMLGLLLKYGARANDNTGASRALWIAAVNGNASAVQYLLEHGANPNTTYRIGDVNETVSAAAQSFRYNDIANTIRLYGNVGPRS